MPQFVPRSETGLRAAGNYIGKYSEYAVLHHTPDQDGQGDYQTALYELRRIEGWHLGNGWSGIGYTYIISGDYAFEGRGYGYSGAHAPGANSNSVGMAFLLDSRDRAPTATEWRTAAAVAQRGVDDGWLTAGFATTGHRDWVATECPAHYVYIDLAHLRNAMNGQDNFPQPVPPSRFGKKTTRLERLDSVKPELRMKPDGKTVDIFDWDLGKVMPCVAYDFDILPIGSVVAVHGRYPGLDNETGERYAQLVWRNGRSGVAGFWWGTNCRLGPVSVPIMHSVVVPAHLMGKVSLTAVMPATLSETTVPL